MNLTFPQPSWQLIEHPQAARRREIAEQATFCAQWLRAQGFEVVFVDKGTRTPPRITIRTSPLCDKLEGAVRAYQRTLRREQHLMIVMRHGCEVVWTQAEEVWA